MKRWLPSLPLSLALLALWLLLNDSVEPADQLLGTLVAVLAPALAAPLRPRGRALATMRDTPGLAQSLVSVLARTTR